MLQIPLLQDMDLNEEDTRPPMALSTPLATLTIRLVLITLPAPVLLRATHILGLEVGLRTVAASPFLKLLPRTVRTRIPILAPPLNVPVRLL